MALVITLSNHKGGVGKTTSTLNIGAGLHKLGKTVLLIDLDPQANLTTSSGIRQPDRTIYDYLKRANQVEPIPIMDKLDIVPATLDLSAAEIELSAETGREYILQELLTPLEAHYDYILIDSPPSLGLLTINALTASQQVFIPLQAHYLAMQGVSRLMEVIKKIQKRLNKNLVIGGVFLTQYDKRKVLHRNVASSVQAHFGTITFSTQIRENIALAEAPTAGRDIFRYQPLSYGATDYMALCQEIISH